MKKSNLLLDSLSTAFPVLVSATPRYYFVLERLCCYRGTVLGKLYNMDDSLTLCTMENAEKMIPTGEFSGRLTHSPKFSSQAFYKKLGGLVPEIYVPDRAGIRIHVANYKREVQGCVGVGLSANCMGVLDSRLAYTQLMSIFDNGKVKEFDLFVIDRFLLDLDLSYSFNQNNI